MLLSLSLNTIVNAHGSRWQHDDLEDAIFSSHSLIEFVGIFYADRFLGFYGWFFHALWALDDRSGRLDPAEVLL